MFKKYILGIDTGSEETGICLIEATTFKPIVFGKIPNVNMFDWFNQNNDKINEENCIVAYEQFKNYGMPIGDSTIKSIEWNGRFLQHLEDVYNIKQWHPVMRVEEKINICGSIKAKDSNIRQALINRFGEVGTKKKPGFFYGFKKDIWSAFAVAVTFIDKNSY